MTRPHSRPTAGDAPKFTTGSLRRHVLVMSTTGALGLMAIFIGDLANIFFLSLLKDTEILAAVGYGSSILFLTTSIGIGLAIATTAVVAPRIGARDTAGARRLATSAVMFAMMVSAAIAFVVWLLLVPMLKALGASGRTLALATTYLQILVPFIVPLAGGMALSAVLRSRGDAQGAMTVTLVGAAVNIALDPLLIFTAGLGIEGAAVASAIARVAILGYAYYLVAVRDRLLQAPALGNLLRDARPLIAIAVPAVATNIATPAANAYVTAAFAPYGDDAVAAWAIIGRIAPVAFGAIYALSGAIGPIIGQNWGARDGPRMRGAITEGLIVTAGFTLAAWIGLVIVAEPLIRAFNATAEKADLIRLFCYWASPLFVFLGAMFVANATFNTLGKAQLATVFNWGRATLGTVPFVMLGGHYAGAAGVLIGNALGQIVFGVLAVVAAYRTVDKIIAAPDFARRRGDMAAVDSATAKRDVGL
jgi:putative MATE family efflux protein